MPTATDLVTDLPADFEVFGQAVATSMADLLGGTSGQILAKNSNTDMDFVWIANDQGDITAVTAGTGISGGGTSGAVTVTNSMATAITTAGDLIKGTGSGTFDRLGIGSSGQVLTVSSGAPAWVTASSGAMTLISTTSFTNQATQAFDGVFSSSYKAYIVYFQSIYGTTANNNIRMQLRKAGPTTVSANYYNGAIAAQPNGTTLITNNNAATYADVSTNFGTSSSNAVSAQFTFLDCSGASAVSKVLYQTCSSYTGVSGNGGFFNSVADTHTGFILSASAGNLTGTVQIFGVN